MYFLFNFITNWWWTELYNVILSKYGDKLSVLSLWWANFWRLCFLKISAKGRIYLFKKNHNLIYHTIWNWFINHNGPCLEYIDDLQDTKHIKSIWTCTRLWSFFFYILYIQNDLCILNDWLKFQFNLICIEKYSQL